MLSRRQITEEDAAARLEELCVRGERCRFELAEKLRKWGIVGSKADRILDSLEERRFYDDARFADAYARDKMEYSRWGRRKIALGLRAKRVDSSIVAEALDNLDEEAYIRCATEFLRAKARSVKEGYTYEGRTRLFRSGIARGYETSLVSAIVKDRATWGLEEE